MPKPEKFWVTYGSRFHKEGHVHNAGCRYFGGGHGAKHLREEIPEMTPDCQVCGGRSR